MSNRWILACPLMFALWLNAANARAAEPAPSVDAVVAQLVRESLASNLQAQSAEATVAQRLAALDQARARYLPALDLDGRYTRADGGRTIDFPLGDLLNPVYATLNQLLVQQGQSPQFGTVGNQRFSLLRTREQETKLTLTQPLYDARIPAAVAASRAQFDGASLGLAAFRAQLARDVRQAYYRWLRARDTVTILDATAELTRSNLRVNESLYRNGKITRDLVYRAEADLLEIEQQRLDAANRQQLAQSYVNLLRNAPFDQAMPAAAVSDDDIVRQAADLGLRLREPALDLQPLQQTAADSRAEIAQLDAGVAAANASQRIARAAFKPRLVFAVEGGIQGEDYGFTADDRYVLASVLLRFNVFNGGADRAGLRSALAATSELRANRDYLEQQIRLQVQSALQSVRVAQASLVTAAKRLEAAEGSFKIAAKKRDLGQINQTEFIDARRLLTDARLNLNVTRFEALASLAELEYAVGLPPRDVPTEMSP